MDFKELMLEQKKTILDTSHLDLPRTTNKTIPTLYLIYTTGATVEAKQLKDNVERIYRGNGITISVETLTFNQAKKAKGLKWEWDSGYKGSDNKYYGAGGQLSIDDENTYAYLITYDLLTSSMGATELDTVIMTQRQSIENPRDISSTALFYVAEDRITGKSGGDFANVSYRVALTAAHETLHYMLIRASKKGAKVPYTIEMGEGEQQGHNNSEINLNMDGQELINQQGWPADKPKDSKLHAAEKILPKHLAIIRQYLGY
jgi:hypothetical protein